jgi:hypothetical protein
MKPKFDFSSVEAIVQLSDIPDEEPNLSIVRHSTALLGDVPSLNLLLPEEDTSQNSYFIKKTTEKQVGETGAVWDMGLHGTSQF